MASLSRRSRTSWLELEVAPLSVEEGLQGRDDKMVDHAAVVEVGQALLRLEEDRRLQRNSGLHAADLGFDESQDQQNLAVKVVDLGVVECRRRGRTANEAALALLGNHGLTRAVGPPHRRIGLREAWQSYERALNLLHTIQEQFLR